MTANGQITLRQSVLDHLGIAPGDRVSVPLRPDGEAEIQPLRRKPEVTASRGILKRPGRPPVSIEEMQDAIEAGAPGDEA